jgi:hypothetical protein
MLQNGEFDVLSNAVLIWGIVQNMINPPFKMSVTFYIKLY